MWSGDVTGVWSGEVTEASITRRVGSRQSDWPPTERTVPEADYRGESGAVVSLFCGGLCSMTRTNLERAAHTLGNAIRDGFMLVSVVGFDVMIIIS